jgi:hypothetical protein
MTQYFKLKTKITPPAAPQRTIILQCLADAYPNALTLQQLVNQCEDRGYRRTFKSETDISKSILWHVDRLSEVEQCSN